MKSAPYFCRCVAASAVLWAGCAVAQTPEPAARQVGVIDLVVQEVPRVYVLPGRAVAFEEADIRPRVGGIVTEIIYAQGEAIEAGDPMFRIDPVTYEAAVAQATANLASARAAVPQAEAAYGRAQALVGSGSTQATLESALATLEQARAAVQGNEATLKLAETELSWTTVTSPIDGMASLTGVSVGDLVTASQADVMATVTRLDPIEVDMYEPSVRLLQIRNDMTEGRLRLAERLQASLTLENGETYEATGEFVAPGYTVSTTTGTVDFRFRFDNPDNRLLPGMFVRGRVELGQTDALLVPQLAATRRRDGQLTAWVIEDGKAAQRELSEDGSYQNSWIVTGGLAEGDQLIVDGRTGLTEGAAVTPVPIEIDAQGVIRDTAPAADAAPAEAE